MDPVGGEGRGGGHLLGSISPGPLSSLEQTGPSSRRQRLVLPTRPYHLRLAQPTKPVLQRQAMPAVQEVLPILLREEMPLTPACPPRLLRYGLGNPPG